MYENKSHKNILIILALSVLAGIVLFYFVWNDIKQKSEHVSSLLNDLSFQTGKEEYISSTNRTIESIKSDLDHIDGSIISSTGDVDFIEGLESIAKENGLSMEISSLIFEDDPKYKSSGVTTLKIKAQAKGSWTGTYKFLEEIESMPFKIKVNQYTMSSSVTPADLSAGTPTKSEWQTDFEIRVLKYR